MILFINCVIATNVVATELCGWISICPFRHDAWVLKKILKVALDALSL